MFGWLFVLEGLRKSFYKEDLCGLKGVLGASILRNSLPWDTIEDKDSLKSFRISSIPAARSFETFWVMSLSNFALNLAICESEARKKRPRTEDAERPLSLAWRKVLLKRSFGGMRDFMMRG